MPFKFERAKENRDVIIITSKIFEDARGFFMETYKKEEFEKNGIKGEFVQDNHSHSKYSVLRGLHFQREPYAQAKIVRCIKGKIFDVAVDLRESRPTFGKYVGVMLSEDNKKMLYIPRGFAHGFLVLSERADVIYKVDNIYAPEYEVGLIWNDSDVGIGWTIKNPILSDKDKKLPTLRELKNRGMLFG